MSTAKKRVRRVERVDCWGWIARRKDGTELGCGPEIGFRWNTRAVAWAVVREDEMLNRAAKGQPE